MEYLHTYMISKLQIRDINYLPYDPTHITFLFREGLRAKKRVTALVFTVILVFMGE